MCACLDTKRIAAHARINRQLHGMIARPRRSWAETLFLSLKPPAHMVGGLYYEY